MDKRTNTAVWHEKQQRWQINVQRDGVRRSFYSSKKGRTGQREANKKADEWLDDNIRKASTRVSSLWNDYYEEKRIATSSPQAAGSIGKNHILPAIGRLKISAVTEQKLQNIINDAYKKGLSRKTIQNIKAVILQFMKFCRKNRVTTLNPEFLYIPKGATTKEKHILQPTDLKILFSSSTTFLKNKEIFDECIYAYRFHVLTGLRTGELLGLKWSDINDNVVHIQRSRNMRNEITTGKNNNAIRSFYLTDMAKAVIDEQPHYPNCEYVFGNMTMDFYRKRWKKYCAHNGIDYVSPYELRHTFISIAKNLPQGDLKTLVGHSASMDTLGIYGHEVNGELKQIAKNLNTIYDKIMNEYNEKQAF